MLRIIIIVIMQIIPDINQKSVLIVLFNSSEWLYKVLFFSLNKWGYWGLECSKTCLRSHSKWHNQYCLTTEPSFLTRTFGLSYLKSQ